MKQQYTVQSLRNRLKQAERQGNDYSLMIPGIKTNNKKITKNFNQLKNEKLKKQEKDNLYNQINQLKGEKHKAVTKYLEDALTLVFDIYDSKYNFELKGPVKHKNRSFYLLPSSFSYKLIDLELQYVLKRSFSLYSPSRHLIAAQIRDQMNRPGSLRILKLDIYKFYDSIDQRRVLDLLLRSRRVDPVSIKLVESLLESFNSAKNRALNLKSSDVDRKGIPQGVGISAKLADLYMKEFDKEWRHRTDILYYGRYVDDIIIIANGLTDLESLKKELASSLSAIGLEISRKKSRTFLVSSPKRQTVRDNRIPPSGTVGQSIDFIGYSFCIDKSGICRVYLSNRRYTKLKNKIDRIFDAWEKAPNSTADLEDLRDSTLIMRLNFLTGNTSLVNAKRHVVVGVYYSNKIIGTNNGQLKKLDEYLKYKIERCRGLSQETRRSVERFSFADRFNDRTYVPSTYKRLKNII
ncbi:antiviral reverse transcriptase Drt3a [Corynebacterium sp. CCM 9204]|uniref:antiviral reverse transcriptase Drt3a n=1 Tax=Corynebacterium sp. CCM 9204 TaxID=3057616 RepID=UPI0035233212